MAARTDLLDWTAVGLSKAALAESAYAAVVSDHEMVVWRGRDRTIHVWENRCPHRGMRLSYAAVRDNRLTCAYHGWTYDSSGSCVLIPAQPEFTPPATIRVLEYACTEQAGIIWAATAGTDADPPRFDGRWTGCRSIAIDRSSSVIRSLLESQLPPLRFPGDAGASTPAPHVMVSGRNRTFRLLLGGSHPLDEVLCALQPITDEQTLLHVSVHSSTNAEGCDGTLRYVSDWARALRSRAEASGIPRADD